MMQQFSFISKEANTQVLNRSIFGNSSPLLKQFIQPKLTINQPNDFYEQEADAMADKVMRMPDTENIFFKPATKLIQRKCASCEEEEKLQMKAGSNVNFGMTVPSTVNNIISSSGQPLDPGTRDFMESRFGYDFSNVEIHNDSMAHQSSAEINALAYTHGNHVVFGAGQYHPGIDSGRKLLAHELTHVVQQNKKGLLAIQKNPDDTGDRFKRKPPGKGAYTQAEYQDWQRLHPNYEFYNGGPFEAESIYRRYTPEWFWKNGYFYAGAVYAGFKGGYKEIWLSNKGKGKEFSIFRGDIAPSAGSKPTGAVKPQAPVQDSLVTENPAIIDPSGDFEKMFGEEIHSKTNVDIIGRGYAIEYADGTIVFYPENGEQTIYKPRMGEGEMNSYDVYDSNGEKVEHLVVGIDAEEVFD